MICIFNQYFLAPPADCCAVQSDDNIPYVCQAVIKIDPNDPSYSKINKTCISFKRVMTASFDFNCEITPQIPVCTLIYINIYSFYLCYDILNFVFCTI